MSAASAPRPGGAVRSAFRAAESRQSQSRTPLENQKQRTCQEFWTPEAARERRARMLLHSTVRRKARTAQGGCAIGAGNAQQEGRLESVEISSGRGISGHGAAGAGAGGC